MSSIVLTGCAIEPDDSGGGKEDPSNERCTDPVYGNGICDLQTSCEAPDIDCFVTFDSQAAAQQKYTEVLASDPGFAGRPPPLPASDARFARMQALVDDAWEAYQGVHDVGALASEKVHVVLIDSSIKNAFAMSVAHGTGRRAALAVMVYSGIIDVNAPDEQLMGVVMHELEHALALHVIPDVKIGFSKYYVAPADTEPFGFEQQDDPAIRALVETWNDQAILGGTWTDSELRGLPFGLLGEVFRRQLAARPATAACTTAKQKVSKMYAELASNTRPLDNSITLPATAPQTIIDMMNEVNAACFVGFTTDVIDVVAADRNLPRATVLSLIPTELRPIIEGKGFMAGVYNWSLNVRTKMRTVEGKLATDTGVPWSRVRYYSTEEAADDASIPTLRAMGLPADGAAKMFMRMSPAALATVCQPLIDGGQPIPYGEDLTDPHHGTCWRAGHITALSKTGRTSARVRTPLIPRRLSVLEAEPKPYSH
ncbi:MAG: M48 family metalloprotease [Deltaproteobacteria bacterium]|nr:M48 family metalloprotease [Deltaproteobacteria bacterium]